MKKILFIINSLGGGGAEKALIEFLRHIDYTRYEVSLCLVFHEGCYLSDVPPEVRVFWLYERERNFVHRKSLKLYRNHGIRTLLRLRARRKIRGRYDAIVSFLEGDALLFHDMVRDRAERNVAWLHCDLRLFHWTRKTFRSDRDEELAYGRMDTIVFCSHITQESFERMYRIDVPKTVIYNIIDGDSIRRQADAAAVPHDGFTITAVGSLSEVKSHDRLVRVARMFKDAGIAARGEGNFVVFNGPDEQFVSGRVIGADGGIGGTYAVMPELYLAMNEHINKGEVKEAQALQYETDRIIYKMCEAHGNLYAVQKEILRRMYGLELGGVREPMPSLIPEDEAIVAEAQAMIEAAIAKL